MASDNPAIKDIMQALAAPFDPGEIKWKPMTVKGNRALAIAYVDARVVQDRLDEVLGIENWQDSYHRLESGSVMCRLRIRLGAEWIAKMDVGSPSEQPDDGDKFKAAVSDALKRTAVKFGVGRYLYRLPSQWVDYDPVKRCFLKQPTLPAAALTTKTTVSAKPQPAAGARQPSPPAQSAAPRSNGPTITQEQFERLGEAIKECRYPARELMTFLGYDRLGLVPQAWLPLIMAIVENGVDLAEFRRRWKIKTLGDLAEEDHGAALDGIITAVPAPTRN